MGRSLDSETEDQGFEPTFCVINVWFICDSWLLREREVSVSQILTEESCLVEHTTVICLY